MDAVTRGLVATGIRVRFGDLTAVDGVDVAVGPGEVVAVLGRSGSGKSTLLRALAGLVPSEGRVELDGEDCTNVPPHRRDMGFMFQEHVLFPHLDVAGNVAYGLRMRRVPRPERDRRVDELLELVGLAGYRDRAVATLSGGEAQRVALARSLAPRPRVLMLDEPLASLDRPRRAQLLDELGRVLRELGQAALYVTHDRDEAFALAGRIAVLDQGRVRRTGAPDAVWREPGCRTVAELLGQVNLVRAGELGLTEAALAAARFAPDDLVSVPAPALYLGDGGAGVSATVVGRRFLGDTVVLTVELATGARLCVEWPTTRPVPASPSVAIDPTGLVHLTDD